MPIDLDEGDEEWICTAHFSPKTQVPADVVGPWKKQMMDKAKNKHFFPKWPHAWFCGYQSHKTKRKIRLIRFLLNRAHMEEEGFHEVD